MGWRLAEDLLFEHTPLELIELDVGDLDLDCNGPHIGVAF